MYQVAVHAEFSAAHAIVIRGETEPLHGHNWHITAIVEGPELDRDGLLVDFHLVEHHLRDIAAGFHNQNLNACRPFADGLNPTAENIARYLAEELSGRMAGRLPRGASLHSIRITEAPGCAATYFPPSPTMAHPA